MQRETPKGEVFRTRLTVDGSRTNIGMDCGTPRASLLTVKLLLNTVISIDGVRSMSFDIKDFYLNTPMEHQEFVRMTNANFPEDVIQHYDLRSKVDDKCQISQRKYRLPSAGIIRTTTVRRETQQSGVLSEL